MTGNPKKIAFVTTMAGAPWGGSEELWSQTALRLKEDGHVVAASVPGWPEKPDAIRRLESAGVELDFRPVKKGVFGKLCSKALKLAGGGAGGEVGRAWLAKTAPDLVVISQGMAWEGLGWMQACRSLGLAYCAVVHANGEHWWPVDEFFDPGVEGYRAAARVCCVSKANLEMLELQLGTRLENAMVVVNPWKGKSGEPCPWPGDEGVSRLACVGRLDPQAKGQDLLMRVMAMPKWRERPVQLTIYGGGPCEKALGALREMLELENVTLAGHVADVAGIWRDNHALVLPSRFEGLPLVIIEAMQHGRPVVTTEVAGNAEYLEEGVSGFVAAAPTVALLDDAMERAWARRADWRAIGAAGRNHVVASLPDDPIGVFSNELVQLAGE
ncbi:MAG: glycosyltransferase family 4 protein [Verrucomicrobiota bacterium JB025]|nr:glycosyltransferase family 4 protein [Verrucomicrobiota bacterium JB025]